MQKSHSKTKFVKGLKTRERIIPVAVRLLGTHGYELTSFQMIADALGLSQSAIMNHFKNKNLLFEAAVPKIIATNADVIAKLIRPTDPAPLRLRSHFEGNLIWAANHDYNAQIMMTLYHFAGIDADFRRLYTAVRTAARAKIAEILRAGQSEGSFRKDFDCDRWAMTLHDMLLGGILNLMTCQREPDAVSGLLNRWDEMIKGLEI